MLRSGRVLLISFIMMTSTDPCGSNYCNTCNKYSEFYCISSKCCASHFCLTIQILLNSLLAGTEFFISCLCHNLLLLSLRSYLRLLLYGLCRCYLFEVLCILLILAILDVSPDSCTYCNYTCCDTCSDLLILVHSFESLEFVNILSLTTSDFQFHQFLH